ncbi:MAG: hypothetical protein AB4372_16000 [Xenococcus sp. (in: cyanobacteria)]
MATSIKVRLQVVGLYLNEEVTVTVPDGQNIRVIDVMNNYRDANPDPTKPGYFHFTDLPARDNPLRRSPNFMQHRPTKVVLAKPTKGGRTLQDGVYELKEEELDQTVLAFQYYVIGTDGKNKSAGNGFTYYDDPNPPYVIENDDTIIWRLVGIAFSPAPDKNVFIKKTV